MSENSQPKENQKGQFDEDQYKMLLRCSEKRDMIEWNEWREANEETPVLLEGAILKETHLESANLTKAHMEGTNLVGTHMEGAKLMGAHLEGSAFIFAHMEGANFINAHLEGANLMLAHLEGVDFTSAYLEGAELTGAHLESADFTGANLEGAELTSAHLEGARLWGTNLKGADCKMSVLDGKTLLWICKIDEETDFTGTGLESARVEPRLKVNLQAKIRRKQWEEWYEEGSKFKQQYKKLIVKPFWWVSDYGRSTGRIVGCFFCLSFIFALFYYLIGVIDGQGIIANLFIDHNTPNGNSVFISPYIVPVRAVYFSIVTMTTLGFGDMYAQAGSSLGHILLTIQVLVGYVLLGALVTRFAILFTSSGPEKDIHLKRTGEKTIRFKIPQ